LHKSTLKHTISHFIIEERASHRSDSRSS